jgi:hypothetical protein
MTTIQLSQLGQPGRHTVQINHEAEAAVGAIPPQAQTTEMSAREAEAGLGI